MSFTLIKTIIFAFLMVGISSKYEQTALYKFDVSLPSKQNLQVMYLSEDSDRLGIISRYNDTKISQTIINLAFGAQECSGIVDINMIPLGFPTHTNLLYYDNQTTTIVKMGAPCAIPLKIANSYDSETLLAVGSTEKESFAVFGGRYRNITEYNIQGMALISQKYNLNLGQKVIFMQYSQDRDYLWVGAEYNSAYKMVSFDTSSGKIKSEIFMYQNTTFLRGNIHGDAFIGRYGNDVYNFNKNGNRKLIRSFDSFKERYLGICTTEDVMVTVKIFSGSNLLTLFVYSTEDGSEIQNFCLDFVPLEFELSKQVISCNDKYLTFLDVDGKIHVFQYFHSLPWWVIALIVVGGVMIIGGGILAFICYRRRKVQKKNGYQQFSNNEGKL